MKTIINYLLLFSLLFIGGSHCAWAAADEARFRLIEKAYTLHADGSTDYHYRKELTLFTHTAMNGTYGETFIVYNPLFQSVKVNESYTRQVDGTVVKTPDNAFVDVLPAAAADAPAFNHLKEKVIVHTGLELGATIVLDYTLHTKAGFFPFFEVLDNLQESSPVERCHVSVTHPAGTEFVCTLPNKVKVKQTSTGFSFELKGIPAGSREPFRASVVDEHYRFYCAVADRQTKQQAIQTLLNEAPTASLRSLAEKISGKAGTQLEKIGTLQQYIAGRLAESRVPAAWTGYRLRSSGDVVAGAYGTKAECARLLATLCRALGWQADVVRIYPNTDSLAMRGLVAAEDWLTAVNIDGKWQLFSPQGAALNTRTDRSQLYTAIDGNNRTIAWKSLNPQLKIDQMVDVKCADAVNGIVTITLPPVTQGVAGWGMGTLATHRETTLALPRCIEEFNNYEVRVEKGLDWLPSSETSKTVANDCGEVTFTIEPTDYGLRVERTIKLYKQHVTPTDYAKLRELLVEWYDANRRTLVFCTK